MYEATIDPTATIEVLGLRWLIARAGKDCFLVNHLDATAYAIVGVTTEEVGLPSSQMGSVWKWEGLLRRWGEEQIVVTNIGNADHQHAHAAFGAVDDARRNVDQRALVDRMLHAVE